ncbi:DUF3530 family protein [Marinobacter fonticola]|uniref:DUF3530 family protein n=1 Tax=Marinobacter fonticola TaxID=2603215 RepID=UPI00143CD696|nr:DUF3530 family protein [Marinobacter fonticola]
MQQIKRRWRLLSIVLGALGTASVAAQTTEQAETEGNAGDVAKEAPATASPSRPFISTQLHSESLAAQFPGQAVWLDVGGDDRVLGLLEREIESPAKGAILILADEGQTADAALAGALRRPLASAGWAAMTLGLEPPPYPLVRARNQPPAAPKDAGEAVQSPEQGEGNATGSAETAGDAGSVIDVIDKADLDQLRQDYRDKLDAQIGAAIAHLRAQGYQRVALAGIGHGAAPVASSSLNGSGAGANEPQALIWVAPTVEAADLDALAGAQAAELQVLDLRSSRTPDRAANEHRSAVRRSGFRGYAQQQIAMQARPTAQDARQVASRISAWLQRRFVSP